MTIRVEFFGIPKQRAGVAAIQVEATTLQEALRQIVVELPRFGESCVVDEKLSAGFIANINGTSFASDGSTPLNPGDTLLILSADAGG